MSPARERALVGIFFIVMGVMIVMAAFGVGPMSGSRTHAPNWVIGLAGVLFASGGVVVLAPAHRVAGVAAGVAVVGLSTVCAWVALFGEAQYFSGGWSVFSRATDVVIARVLFGLVALLGIAISVHAVRRTLRRRPAAE